MAVAQADLEYVEPFKARSRRLAADGAPVFHGTVASASEAFKAHTPDTKAPPPQNYSDLFRQYFDYIKALVRKYGIADDEDAAAEILMKFYEQGYLEKFNPEYRDGEGRRSNFKGYLSSIVGLYVLQCRDRQMVRANKEPIHLEDKVSGTEGDTWIDVYAPVEHTGFAAKVDADDEFRAEVAAMYEYLKTLPIKGRTPRRPEYLGRDLALVFKRLLEQVLFGGQGPKGEVSRKPIAQELGDISDTAMSLIMNDLRLALIHGGFAPERFLAAAS